MSDTVEQRRWHLLLNGWESEEELTADDRAVAVETWEVSVLMNEIYGTFTGLEVTRTWYDPKFSDEERAALREQYRSPWLPSGPVPETQEGDD